MKLIGPLVLVILSVWVFGCASTAKTNRSLKDDVPLPPNVIIIPPDENQPADIRAFSGKWSGKWTTGRKHMLVVERLNQTEADVIYAWGSRAGDAPDWRRLNGRIEPGKLTLYIKRTSGDATIIYRLNTDMDTLDAMFVTHGNFWTSKMKRVR